MKRLHTGVIVFDAIDIICISFCAGTAMAFCYIKYKKYKRRKKLLKNVLLLRGGDKHKLKAFSLAIKNKKLADLIRVIVNAKRAQRHFRLLRYFFLTFNTLLTNSVNLRFAVGGSLNYTQIILISFSSTLSGFLIGLATSYPVGGFLIGLAILHGRGIEDIPDPYAKCKAICKVVEDFHNKQLAIEMKKLNSLVEDASAALQLPIEEVPLLCVEEKLSLLQRYKLREVIKSAKAQKRVQHFSEFIKKFPQCDADPEVVYEEIVGKIAE